MSSSSKPGIVFACDSSSSSKPGTVFTCGSSSSSKPGIVFTWGSSSSSKPGIVFTCGSSSSSKPGIVFTCGSSSSSSKPGIVISSCFFLGGLPLLFGLLSSALTTSSSVFFLGGLPLLFVLTSSTGSGTLEVSSSSIPSIIGSIGSGIFKPEEAVVLADIFFTLFVFTADGIITGLRRFLSPFEDSINPIFNPLSSISLVLAVPVELLFSPINDIICWYLGDFSSNIAFTFKGRKLAITFNWTSVYCCAIESKLSTHFCSSLPIFL